MTHAGALLFGQEPQIYKSSRSLRLPQQKRIIHTDLFRSMQPHLSWVPCAVASSITVTNFPRIAPVPPVEVGCGVGGCTWKLGGCGLGDCGVSAFLLGRLALLSWSNLWVLG